MESEEVLASGKAVFGVETGPHVPLGYRNNSWALVVLCRETGSPVFFTNSTFIKLV